MNAHTLTTLAREVQLIARVTPENARAEVERLRAAGLRGEACMPRWQYARHDTGRLDDALHEATRRSDAWPEPLRSLVHDRLEELRLELALVSSVAKPAFSRLAARRFPLDVDVDVDVDGDGDDDDERLPSDSPDPRSLLSQVRALIGSHRAPFSVVACTTLSAIAATGDRTVYVACGVPLTERAARRIATHEVLGHVLPRVRAERAHPVFAFGTAGGTDDQEGLALLHEERGGLLDQERRADLSRRHHAVRSMREGADFVEVARDVEARGGTLDLALRIATRVFRGSDGTFPGLGREAVYLPALARVRSHIARRPADEAILGCGQVAVGALARCRELSPPRGTRELAPSG